MKNCRLVVIESVIFHVASFPSTCKFLSLTFKVTFNVPGPLRFGWQQGYWRTMTPCDFYFRRLKMSDFQRVGTSL